MAINPEEITTVRVDQLTSAGLTLDSLFPHTVGTELKSSTIETLVTLVANAVETLNGVGFLPVSVTDGQTLPTIPENPSFILVGAGTYGNLNGFADLVCTENLNALMSVTDHWEIAVQIPINPLTGTVETVTGSAVDNTDPLNPIINLSSAVTSVNGLTGAVVVDGDNIDVTDPTTSTDATLNDALANIYASGGATPDLQAVTDAGNETTNIVKFVVDADNYIEIDTVNRAIKVYADGVLYNHINPEGIVNYAFGNADYFSSLTNGALFVGSLLSSDASIFDLNKIINNGVDYPLPMGASSPLATLADITGGGGYTVVSSNQTASNDTNYTVVANATFTDPSPTEGKGYVVYVRNGTATIGGTGYGVGSLVFRVFHSGAWSTREYKSNLTASDIPSGIDAVKIADGSVSNTEFQYINSLTSNAQTQLDHRSIVLLNDNVDSSAVTGTVANSTLKAYLIPANTLAVGDTIDFKSVCSKTNGGTPANCNFRIYTNTTNNLGTALPLALVVPASNNLYFSLDRTYTLKSGNTLESFPVNSSAPTDEVATAIAISNTTFNPAVDNYFIVAIQPNNASDSFKQTLCYITLMKAKTSI